MKTVTASLAALALLAGAAARATVIRRLSLPEVCAHASEVFVGSVRSTEARDGGPPRHLVMTDVTFDDLEVVKGKIPGSTVTYRFAGGTLGNRTLTVVGMPRFAVGERYVLFTNAELDWICPAVGWGQGRYTVLRDEERKEDVLADSAGRPVYRFEKGFPVLEPARKGERPMLLSTFLERVRGLLEPEEEEPGEKEPAQPDPGKGGRR